MKLLRLGTSGFGGLRGYFRFDPNRLTVVVDDNERGKSTMLAAVAAALYGLGDDRRSHRLMTPLERWRPWDGSSYDVEIEVECEGARYTISRDFDRCTVGIRDGAGHDVAAEFRDGKEEYPVGQKLLGLDAAPPAAFLALLAPRLRAREPLAIALAAAVVAIAVLPFVPAGVPLLIVALLVALFGWLRKPD